MMRALAESDVPFLRPWPWFFVLVTKDRVRLLFVSVLLHLFLSGH